MRCIKRAMKNTTKEFYDSLSGFYDDMIGFEKSVKNRTQFYSQFTGQEVRSAADLGCGTGLDSIALSMNGLDVTGFDISSKMILTASRNSLKHRSRVKFVRMALDRIPKKYFGRFDLVVSMGNSLANLDRTAFKKVITAAFKLLRTGGVLITQVLNYQRIISGNNRIVGVGIIPGGGHVIRFYDFHSGYINFNILKIDSMPDPKHDLITTKVYPYVKSDFQKTLSKAGFSKMNFYGSLSLGKYDRNRSNDLIVIAKKM